jgi:hypothetical protein
MAEITLADYTGYIFREIIRAREMADQHSRQLAEVYAKDPVMKHFSVPRFKVPKMELTIPVLISGARFNQVVRFAMPRGRFVAYIVGLIQEVIGIVRSKSENPFNNPRPTPAPTPAPTPRPRAAKATAAATRRTRVAAAEPMLPASREGRAAADMAERLAVEFWDALNQNPDPSQPGEIVRKFWTAIFQRALTEEDLVAQYKKTNPNNELFRQTMEAVVKTVNTNTVVDSTTIQSLLINPETNVVKTGSSETSVFTLKAEMLEEGFFIREITDESGQKRPVVEFE